MLIVIAVLLGILIALRTEAGRSLLAGVVFLGGVLYSIVLVLWIVRMVRGY